VNHNWNFTNSMKLQQTIYPLENKQSLVLPPGRRPYGPEAGPSFFYHEEAIR